MLENAAKNNDSKDIPRRISKGDSNVMLRVNPCVEVKFTFFKLGISETKDRASNSSHAEVWHHHTINSLDLYHMHMKVSHNEGSHKNAGQIHHGSSPYIESNKQNVNAVTEIGPQNCHSNGHQGKGTKIAQQKRFIDVHGNKQEQSR